MNTSPKKTREVRAAMPDPEPNLDADPTPDPKQDTTTQNTDLSLAASFIAKMLIDEAAFAESLRTERVDNTSILTQKILGGALNLSRNPKHRETFLKNHKKGFEDSVFGMVQKQTRKGTEALVSVFPPETQKRATLPGVGVGVGMASLMGALQRARLLKEKEEAEEAAEAASWNPFRVKKTIGDPRPTPAPDPADDVSL